MKLAGDVYTGDDSWCDDGVSSSDSGEETVVAWVVDSEPVLGLGLALPDPREG